MDERISVGTSFGNGWFITAVSLAAVGLLAGLSLIAFQPTAATIVLLAAAACALVALVHGLVIARGRKWFTATDDGFVYEDRRGQFDFRDEDVSELGTWAKTRYSNGVPKAVRRDCLLVLSAGDYRGDLAFRYSFPLAKPDPLAEFLDRNLDRLATDAAARLERGDVLTGDGWELDAKELVLTGRKDEDTYPAADLVAVDVVDHEVSVWVRGEAKPILATPAASVNALVLLRVLKNRFQSQPAKPDDEPGFGRIVFERDRSTSPGMCVFGSVVGLGMFVGGLVALAVADRGPNGTVPTALGCVLTPVGPIIAFLTWFNRVNVFRCHSRGVCLIKTRSRKELAFADVAGFTYGAIRQYVNGGYTGTTVTLTFEPREDSDGDRIVYAATSKRIDGELDNLREHVSRVLAAGMKARMDAGKAIRWTDGLRFTTDGLEVELASGRLSAGKSRLLAYDKCLFNLNEGYFFLFKKGGQESLYSVPVSSPNFFPGFALLNQLVYPPRPKEDEDDVPNVQNRRTDA